MSNWGVVVMFSGLTNPDILRVGIEGVQDSMHLHCELK